MDDDHDPAPDETAVLARRSRQRGRLAVAAVAAVAVLGALLAVRVGSGSDDDGAGGGSGGRADVDRVLAGLGDEPIDPTEVQLVASVSTFPDCDALVGDLRRVGAEHVGSRGFGGFSGAFAAAGAAVEDAAAPSRTSDVASSGAGGDGTTLGTNVQVTGVDELDVVKAEGNLIYDLDGKGALRITDAGSLEVLSTLDVTPSGPDGEDGRGGEPQVTSLLVADGRVAVFGSEVEVSEPVEGDPSATEAATSFMTVAFVDATDPASPALSDRVRIEGSLVSARLVGGEIRMVTTSNMADLGFVMPTTPTSVPKALDANRRSVAGSSAADWIPDWQRDGADPEPLVPCERVHVPDTFAGVAMTSMVTFPVGSGRFAPAGTSILAPATTLYAGTDKVAISSEVWVDPIDRGRLDFDDGQTAVHEFSFPEADAPAYVGSGIVDGSTVGQFAFGEIGDSLAVVTTQGTPWQQQPDVAVDLTVLTDDGDGGLDRSAQVPDLAEGDGQVVAVRFVEGRVLISTGPFGNQVQVIDVEDPTAPRRAGRLTIPGNVGYFHPLAEHRALLVGSRTDEVDVGDDTVTRSWVRAQLLDVADPDAPHDRRHLGAALDLRRRRPRPPRLHVLARPPAGDVGPARHQAGDRGRQRCGRAGHRWRDHRGRGARRPQAERDAAAVPDGRGDRPRGPSGWSARTGSSSAARATPLARSSGPGTGAGRIEESIIARFAPGEQEGATFQLCSPAPQPAVSRVLVVSGRPILLTDQTLEALDPDTFASTAIAYHPTEAGYAY